MRIVLKISTRSLYLGAYSKTQQWLFERVKTLRVEEKLTFPQIAEHLTKFGIRSTRGKKLSAEHVFSILNKGLVKEANQMTNAVVTVAEISLIKTLS